MSSLKSRIAPELQDAAPWHSLNFLPDPHGHGALRGVFEKASFTTVAGLPVGPAWAMTGCLGWAAGASMSPLATAWAAARSKPDAGASSLDEVCRFITCGSSLGCSR